VAPVVVSELLPPHAAAPSANAAVAARAAQVMRFIGFSSVM
jgi:hypothetical protein